MCVRNFYFLKYSLVVAHDANHRFLRWRIGVPNNQCLLSMLVVKKLNGGRKETTYSSLCDLRWLLTFRDLRRLMKS
jgi:hypothetical protein